MEKIVYNKLVRDRIPAMIEGEGKSVTTRILDEGEYRTHLRQKLDEEIREYDTSEDVEELADIAEILYALAALRGVGVRQFELMRSEKRVARGGFERRILLIEAER